MYSIWINVFLCLLTFAEHHTLTIQETSRLTTYTNINYWINERPERWRWSCCPECTAAQQLFAPGKFAMTVDRSDEQHCWWIECTVSVTEQSCQA